VVETISEPFEQCVLCSEPSHPQTLCRTKRSTYRIKERSRERQKTDVYIMPALTPLPAGLLEANSCMVSRMYLCGFTGVSWMRTS
jgi:hypothetical protein